MTNWVSDEVDARWAAFPIDASPRPIVLLDERVRIEGGFEDGNSKEAWLGGRIKWAAPVPPAVAALLPAWGPAHTDRELTVTEIVSTAAEFQEPPAYVVGRAITSERTAAKGTFVTLVGICRMVTGRLTSPLNGRVLVDTVGRPLSVAAEGDRTCGVPRH